MNRLIIVLSLVIAAFFTSSSFAACVHTHTQQDGTSPAVKQERCMNYLAAPNNYNSSRPFFYCSLPTASYNHSFGYTCDVCPNNQVCENRYREKVCAPTYTYNPTTDKCDPPAPVVTPQDCFAENKLFDAALEQCGETCPIGYTASLEGCTFSGCPIGYDQLGSRCIESPPNCEQQGQQTVCNDIGCHCADKLCTPNHPSYQGTENGTHFCNEPALSCAEGQKVGWATVKTKISESETVTKQVQVCVGANGAYPDDEPLVNDGCTGGKVSIDGICQYPKDYVQEGTQVSESVAPDGSRTVTTTTTTTTTTSDGRQQTTVSTTSQHYDSDNQLLGTNTEETTKENSKSESVVRGGDGCAPSDKPTCVNADAVACAHLQQTWLHRCESKESSLDIDDTDLSGALVSESDASNAAVQSLESSIDTLISDNTDSSFDKNRLIDLSNAVPSPVPTSPSVDGSCPPDIVLQLLDNQISIPISQLCTLLAYIGILVRISAGLIALRMTYTTLQGL